MSLAEVTSPDAIRAAIAEFDKLGRKAFLTKYGFGQAKRYFIRMNDRLYDSKAIVGAARGFEHPERGPMPHTDFAGGEATVKAKLEQLGFEVVSGTELRAGLEHALALIRSRPPGAWSSELQQSIVHDLRPEGQQPPRAFHQLDSAVAATRQRREIGADCAGPGDAAGDQYGMGVGGRSERARRRGCSPVEPR